MRRIILLILVSIIIIPGFAQKSLPQDVEDFFNHKREAYFKIDISGKQDVVKLNRMISLDIIEQDHVTAYAGKSDFKKFLDLDLDYEFLTNPSELIVPIMYDGSKESFEWDAYPTYDAYVAMMYQFASDYPDICEVFSIGDSGEGREILMAKISDNISTDEAEPQVLYTGTMHGDETAGYVLLLRLIDYFVSNYGTDAEVTDMVNGMEIWINPAANPDGTYAGGNNTVFGATRSNANGVDLNRNYKDPQLGDHPDGNAWQIETIEFMNLAEETNFVISANFHGGAEVINYPWDYQSALSADDDWWQFVSHEYADTAQHFSPSTYLNGFDDGITNGNDWYETHGNRQDFMNYFHNCRECTIELSDVKLISESMLEAHWDYNERSLINYLKQAKYGVRGMVTDSESGEPLDAKIEIIGHDIYNSFVYTREGLGNYYRLLKEGTYDITFSAGGYASQTIENVEVTDYNATILNVELVSAGLQVGFTSDETIVTPGSTVAFTQECFGDPETYLWTFEGGEPATSTDPNPTVVYNETGAYDVTLLITSGGESVDMIAPAYILVNEEYFMEDQEITTCSGTFYDNGGMDSNYGDSKDYTTTIYGSETADNYILEVEFTSFAIEAHASCNYDYLKIYDGADDNATLIGTYCGTDSPGTVSSSNDDHALTFVFHSDGSVNDAGWQAIISCTLVEAVEELAENHFQIFPNPVDDGRLTIKSDYIIEEIQVNNIGGQLVLTEKAQSNNETLDVSALKAGVYILTIKTKFGVHYKKIQIQ